MRVLTAIVSLALIALPAAATPTNGPAALGAQGEIYLVIEGLYGELFPAGTETTPEAPVLALDIVTPGETPWRRLVPGTEGLEDEHQASALYEQSSDTLFVLWESRVNGIHSLLQLAALSPDGWGETIELSGNPFGFKGDPQFTVSRESFAIFDDAEKSSAERTVLHLMWWEQGSPFEQVMYTPIVLEDGRYSGGNQVYRLTDFFDVGTGGAGGSTSTLLTAPALAAGRNDSTVVIGFADGERGALVTLEVEVLSKELTNLADSARDHIIRVGAASLMNIQVIADEARAHIVQVGAHLNPDMVALLAAAVRLHILEIGGDYLGALVSLADAARAHIVHVGAKLDREGLSMAHRAMQDRVLEVPLAVAGHDDRFAAHYFQVRLVSSRPTPVVGGDDVSMYLSSSGEDVIVAWDEQDFVGYRESMGAGWSQARRLELGPQLSRTEAHRILVQRLRD